MSTTCPFCQKKSNPCPFCERPGLPILPLRYAVARADRGGAPALSAPFGAGVNDIVLPAKMAHYTTRLLRSGYLYAYDEKRRKWYAYVVTEESYLYDFVPGKTPPDVAKLKFQCHRQGDALLARCIKIEDADKAGIVWVGFSDTPWTPAVLKKHDGDDGRAYRAAHMRKIDIAAWLGGSNKQPHTAPMDELTSRVAEFAAAVVGQQPRRTTLLGVLDKMYDNTMRYTRALFEVPAFDFSPHKFVDASAQAEEFLAEAAKACAIHKPALLGLDDATGIAMELNQLAQHRAAEWMEEPERKWKFQTATTIESIKAAVGNGAVKQESADRKHHAEAEHAVLSMMMPTITRQITRPGWQDRVGIISPAEQLEINKHAWEKYQKCYDDHARLNYIETYKRDLKAFDAATIKPLDAAYVKWLESTPFKRAFTRNFDPANIDSGLNFVLTMYACIHGATGRNAAMAYFTKALESDPTHADHVIVRALVFGQDALARKWAEAAAGNAKGDMPWLDIGSKVYDALKDTFVKGSTGKLEGAASNVSKCLYQLGGPIISRLGDLVDGGLVWAAAKLPEKRMLGLMQAVLTVQHPGMVIGALHFEGSRTQTAHALATALAEMSGGRASLLQSGARRVVDVADRDLVSGRALLVMQENELDALKKLSGRTSASVRAEAVAAAVSVENFELEYASCVRRVGNAEVKGGVIGALFAALGARTAFKDLAKAEATGTDVRAKLWNVRGGMSSLAGGMADVGGSISKSFAWGAAKPPLLGEIEAMGTWTKALTGVAKLLGAVGGVIAGVLEFMDGIEEAKINLGLGLSMMALGFMEAFAAVLILFLDATGVGLILGLIIAAAIWLLSLFKEDDLQKWLEKCKFGHHPGFSNFTAQNKALEALAQG
jgi:hypothetical protein